MRALRVDAVFQAAPNNTICAAEERSGGIDARNSTKDYSAEKKKL
jgi:hypothetical protein